jgi:hypothetical protein
MVLPWWEDKMDADAWLSSLRSIDVSGLFLDLGRFFERQLFLDVEVLDFYNVGCCLCR